MTIASAAVRPVSASWIVVVAVCLVFLDKERVAVFTDSTFVAQEVIAGRLATSVSSLAKFKVVVARGTL